MRLEERGRVPALARPAVVVTAALLACFVALSLGTPFLWQAEVRWKRAKLRSDRGSASQRPEVGSASLAEAPSLAFHLSDSPPRRMPDAGVEPSRSISNVVTLMIALDDSGAILADGEPRTLGDLRAILQAASLASHGDIKAVLAVDDRCPYECISVIKRVCEDAGAEITQIRESEISVDLRQPKLIPPIDITGSHA